VNRGQIIKKGDRKFLLRIYIGRTPQGKRQYVSKTIEGTYRQADQELTRMLRAKDDHTLVEPSKQTVGEFLPKWLESKRNLSYTAAKSYGNLITHRITPLIGNVRLDQLNRHHIEGLVSAQVQEEMSPRTIQYTLTVLKMALRKAIEWGFLVRNPAEGIETPKQIKRAPSVFTPEQAAAFLKSSQGERLYPLWVLLLATGVRPEEAFALTWEDVDLTAGTLTVTKAMQLVGPGKYAPLDTKTDKSKRTVSFSEGVKPVLEAWRRESLKEQMEGGFRTNLVFHNTVGKHLEGNSVRMQWKRALKHAGMPDTIRLYDARHTHLTHLLMLGYNPKVAADRAGHSTVTITLDTYSHVLPELDKQAGEDAGNLLFKEAVQ